MKNVLAFVLACVSAYAISFSADLLFGAILRIYPRDTTLLPIFVWWFIATITGVAAVALSRKRFLAIPFVIITLVAAFGGIVGRRYDLAVAGVMALATIWVGLLTASAPEKRASNQ